MVTRTRNDWILLSYRLPRNPSAPRIAHWRAIRRLGAALVQDGLVALPASDRTREQFEWMANAVVEADGTAQVWIARLASASDERTLIDRMGTEVDNDYRALARTARAQSSPRSLARLRRELRKIIARDYFGSPRRDEAEQAVSRLARRVEGAA